jgi:hypothetical protein
MPDIDYAKNLVKASLGKTCSGAKKGPGATAILMSRNQVPNSTVNIEFSWVYSPTQLTRHVRQHTNNCEELILHIGTDPEKPEALGAEVAFNLGGQEISFSSSSCVYIPAGVPHGRILRRQIARPYIEIAINLGQNAAASPGNTASLKMPTLQGVDFEKYLVRKPAYETMTQVKNRQCPTMTFMSRKLVPEASYYVELGWIYGMPEPKTIHEHMHKFDEVVMHWGCDPENPSDLGAEIEAGIGGQPVILNETCALWLPKQVLHTLTWKKVTRPHIEMAFMVGAGTMKEGWADSGIGGPNARPIPD